MNRQLTTLLVLCAATNWSCGAGRAAVAAKPRARATANADTAAPRDVRAIETDALLAKWDKRGSPGVAVMVSRDGKTLYRGAVGSANLEYGVPLTPETVFQSASISKQITAFAIAMLSDQGKLSLDDEVRQHIPELADFGAPLKIRHLVHHTSGLRDEWELLFFAGWRRDDVVTHEHVLRMVGYQKTLNFRPGEQFLYTNTGYTLLAEIVQRVTNQPFAQWVAHNIFKPLDMRDTQIRDSLGDVIEGRAYSYYQRSDGRYDNATSNSAVLGGSNVFTTVSDLSKWARNLDDGALGGEALVKRVQEPGKLNNGEATSYAFGMFVGTQGGVRMVSHGGGVAGFRTYLLRAPEHQFSVVVLANVNTVSAGALARQIARVYLDEAMTQDPEDAPKDAPIEPDSATRTEPGAWNTYVGTYLMAPGLTFTVRQRGRGLTVQATGEAEVDMRPTATSEFAVQGYGGPISFSVASDDGARSLVFRGARGPRVVPFSPLPAQLQEYTGTFYADELRTIYELAIDDDTLVLRHLRLGDIRLNPTVADQFGEDMADDFGITNRWFRSFDFARDKRGRITGFSLSVGGAKNVWFEKRGSRR